MIVKKDDSAFNLNLVCLSLRHYTKGIKLTPTALANVVKRTSEGITLIEVGSTG